jgi:hypothetical protein
MIHWEMLNSDAYKELSHSAAKALPYFIGKDGKAQQKSGSRTRSEIEFPYGEATRLGFATRTFSRVIQGLTAQGFIDPVAHGGLRGLCKSTNKFRISERWRAYGKPDFKKVSWITSEPIIKKGYEHDLPE